MRIAAAQIVSGPEPRRNLELVEDAAGRAARDGARLVVLPEATMCALGVPLGPVAEPLDGPWASAVRDIARSHGITVVAGMFTPGDDGRVRNTLLATDGRGPGGVEAAYDKIHLYDAHGFLESRTVAPGAEPVTIEVDGVVLGLTVCYDVRFPGLYQALADRGARIMLLAASWGAGPGKREQWDLLTRARALDSTSALLAAAQGDPAGVGRPAAGPAPTGIGRSVEVDPTGAVRQQLDAAPGLLVVDVDLAEIDRVRDQLPVLANRRW
ncbi:carbon-nitrogen hydrolase family protein [Nakamurella sp.]|uniref:carbon-nitrogen hydrolase family protein n=1 Tax=Nakamurella sp. TaxID=1869182 RepID=UPI003B3AFD9A